MRTGSRQLLGAFLRTALVDALCAMTASGSLVKLAETGEVEPGGTSTIFQIAPTPALSADGKVVFHTDLRKNGITQGWGLFQSDGTNLEAVVRTGQPSPDLNGSTHSTPRWR